MKTTRKSAAATTAEINATVTPRHPKSPTPENPHGFLRRYWLVILLCAFCAFLALDETLYKTLGTLIYAPVLGFMAIILSALARRLTSQHTTDSDAREGVFNLNWANLDPRTKCILQVVERCVYLYVFAQIVVAVMK